MACVEIPANRALSKRISEGEYQDCIYWARGEERRWKFGFGRGVEKETADEIETWGIGSDFRWRRWRGLKKELRRELDTRGELVERDSRPIPQLQGEVSAYSVSPASCTSV